MSSKHRIIGNTPSPLFLTDNTSLAEELSRRGYPSPRIHNSIWLLGNFNEPLDFVNVNAVTNFNTMFLNAELFDKDLSHWNVSNGKSFRGMFMKAKSFNQDISNWIFNPDIYQNMGAFEGMFSYCDKFNQDLSNWDLPGKFRQSIAEDENAYEDLLEVYMIDEDDLVETPKKSKIDLFIEECIKFIFLDTRMYDDWEAASDDEKRFTNFGLTLAGLTGSYIGGKKRNKKRRTLRSKRRCSKRRCSKRKRTKRRRRH